MPRDNTAFMKPVQPDAILAAIVGADPIPRTEITVRIWDYIRRGKLQGQQVGDRRNIYARDDHAFREFIGGADSCTMFELQKFVGKHLTALEG